MERCPNKKHDLHHCYRFVTPDGELRMTFTNQRLEHARRYALRLMDDHLITVTNNSFDYVYNLICREYDEVRTPVLMMNIDDDIIYINTHN